MEGVMTRNPGANDPKTLWRNQEKENRMISAREVREKVRKYNAKIRREGIVAFVLSLGALVFCGVIIVSGHPASVVVAAMAVLLLLGQSREMFVAYKARKNIWPWLPATADTLSTACIDFYRQGLERQQRNYTNASVVFIFAAVFLVMTIALIQRGSPVFANALIFVCIGLIFFARRREARKVQREIDALDAFEDGPR
jgi:Flp pilus assembly protein TadB